MYSKTTMALGAVRKPVKTQNVNVLNDRKGVWCCKKTYKYKKCKCTQ